MASRSDSLRPPLTSTAEIEDVMTEPSAGLIEQFSCSDGGTAILGAGGKMGPTLATMAAKASQRPGGRNGLFAVSRFSDEIAVKSIESAGVTAIRCDLLDRQALAALPDAANVVFMAGRKFGSTGAEDLTWALNTYLPALVAERYRDARIVVFSTGNVYPFTTATGRGADESTPPNPVGEYAQSCLGRERIFEHFSRINGTEVMIVRLNYSIDVRYGVLVDICTKVMRGEPVDVSMGHVNVIWQGDACDYALRCLDIASSPPRILNVAGPENLSVRWIAEQFAEHFGLEPNLTGEASSTALLSDSSRCGKLFGPPRVSVEQMIHWVAEWLRRGGATLKKPTRFEVRDGRF